MHVITQAGTVFSCCSLSYLFYGCVQSLFYSLLNILISHFPLAVPRRPLAPARVAVTDLLIRLDAIWCCYNSICM